MESWDGRSSYRPACLADRGVVFDSSSLIINAESPAEHSLRQFQDFKRQADEFWLNFASERLDELAVKHHVAGPGTWGHKLKDLRDSTKTER